MQPEDRAADRDVTEFKGDLRDFRRATAASFNAARQDFVDLRHKFGDFRAHAKGPALHSVERQSPTRRLLAHVRLAHGLHGGRQTLTATAIS